ncbi:hypothetical protein AHAS_Ahas02G0149500 [Arachis hypogaea]
MAIATVRHILRLVQIRLMLLLLLRRHHRRLLALPIGVYLRQNSRESEKRYVTEKAPNQNRLDEKESSEEDIMSFRWNTPVPQSDSF